MREFQRPTPNVQRSMPNGSERNVGSHGERSSCNAASILRRFNGVALLTFLTVVACSTALAVGGVDATPSPAPAHEISFTHPNEAKLDNGLRVIVAERPSLPLLAMELIIRVGSEKDPNDRAGTASLTGSLLTKGTEQMTAPEIANAIESLGGTIFSSGVSDYSSAGVLVMSSKAEPALTILSDVVLHPAFKEEEIDRLKKQSLDGLRVALQQPGSLASYVVGRVVYGEGEYGHASGGTPETLPAIQRSDILNFYQNYYQPDNATLVFSGNVTFEQGKEYAEKFFGNWKANQTAPRPVAPTAGTWKPTTVVVDMPEAGQASVSVTKPAIKRDSPDYYSGLVANAALGNGFGSRLNREIRIKRGLSYGAHSSLDARRDAGAFTASAQTKNESAPEVATLLQAELKRFATEPVQGDELKSRQALLTGGYARSLETDLGFASHIAVLAVFGLPLDTLDKFIPSINAITANDVTAFTKKYLAAPSSLVVVGKASVFIEPLKKYFPETRVIAQSDLDLNRADLVNPK
jgi:zinc protease